MVSCESPCTTKVCVLYASVEISRTNNVNSMNVERKIHEIQRKFIQFDARRMGCRGSHVAPVQLLKFISFHSVSFGIGCRWHCNRTSISLISCAEFNQKCCCIAGSFLRSFDSAEALATHGPKNKYIDNLSHPASNAETEFLFVFSSSHSKGMSA